jgi:hypothetical protein
MKAVNARHRAAAIAWLSPYRPDTAQQTLAGESHLEWNAIDAEHDVEIRAAEDRDAAAGDRRFVHEAMPLIWPA